MQCECDEISISISIRSTVGHGSKCNQIDTIRSRFGRCHSKMLNSFYSTKSKIIGKKKKVTDRSSAGLNSEKTKENLYNIRRAGLKGVETLSIDQCWIVERAKKFHSRTWTQRSRFERIFWWHVG